MCVALLYHVGAPQTPELSLHPEGVFVQVLDLKGVMKGCVAGVRWKGDREGAGRFWARMHECMCVGACVVVCVCVHTCAFDR